MRKIFGRATLALAFFLAFAGVSSVYAEQTTVYDIESALMKYILCYEAYKEAKQSENPEVRADLASYIKAYREAYAEYLQLLHEEDLYQPDKKDMDPATDYNKQRVADGKKKIIFGQITDDSQREKIKEGIKAGKSIEEILDDVDSNLPKETMSEVSLSDDDDDDEDDDDGILYGNEGVNTQQNSTSSDKGSNSGKNTASGKSSNLNNNANPSNFANPGGGPSDKGIQNGSGNSNSSAGNTNGAASRFPNTCPWIN